MRNDKKLHILLVEDDSAVALTTAQMLEFLGHRVTVVGLPGEACRTVAEAQPGFDLVLSDITMPEMTGQEMARRLHEFAPNLPVLFMSGYDFTSTETGHFLMKPLSLSSLRQAIARAYSAQAASAADAACI